MAANPQIPLPSVSRVGSTAIRFTVGPTPRRKEVQRTAHPQSIKVSRRGGGSQGNDPGKLDGAIIAECRYKVIDEAVFVGRMNNFLGRVLNLHFRRRQAGDRLIANQVVKVGFGCDPTWKDKIFNAGRNFCAARGGQSIVAATRSFYLCLPVRSDDHRGVCPLPAQPSRPPQRRESRRRTSVSAHLFESRLNLGIRVGAGGRSVFSWEAPNDQPDAWPQFSHANTDSNLGGVFTS